MPGTRSLLAGVVSKQIELNADRWAFLVRNLQVKLPSQ